MTTDEINSLVTNLGSILTVLRDADPLDKTDLQAKVACTRPTLAGQQQSDRPN
jgi:hypothetical protein